MQSGCSLYENPARIIQTEYHVTHITEPPWRNRLARSAVNRRLVVRAQPGVKPFMQSGCSLYENPARIIQTEYHVTHKPPWRNRLARSAVNRKVGGSRPPGAKPFFMKSGCSLYENPARIIQTEYHVTHKPPWRNRLARSAVNRKVGGSSPPGAKPFFMQSGCSLYENPARIIQTEYHVTHIQALQDCLTSIFFLSPVTGPRQSAGALTLASYRASVAQSAGVEAANRKVSVREPPGANPFNTKVAVRFINPRIIQTGEIPWYEPPWRNRLARSAVNRKSRGAPVVTERLGFEPTRGETFMQRAGCSLI
ncbi:hypothetical protein TNIN_237191 [Trichonephila inaurata madagascariensis]|uniref:Uncharacterized protein n=1 Tax=Trichonephila inaurata madagascariensis TaxID=2747483 RepID=A0A8X7CNN1_9ARAC|nr:hypothetical protein TNIN_237191 [Trichonephila inaurata madagascariensis]